MSGDYEWRKSLRKNADTGRSKSAKPRKQQTKQRSQVNRIQSASQTRPQRHTEMANRKLHSVTQEEKAIICANCQEHLEPLYEQYETRCNCDRKFHFMCRKCFLGKTMTYQYFVARCGRSVCRTSFSLITSSSTPSYPQPNKPRGQDSPLKPSQLHPKCDSCDKEEMLVYILPCDHKICETCFQKDKVVKMTDNESMLETKQTFLCCKKDGETKCLYAIQRVHMISQRHDRNNEGLVCVYCTSGIYLNETCVVLKCNHCVCAVCYDSSSAGGFYCPLCCEKCSSSKSIENAGSKYPDVLTSLRKFNVGKESMCRIVDGRDASMCRTHENLRCCIQLHCGTQLCVLCIEDKVAEKNIVRFKMDDNPASEKHCICSCQTWNGRHILSLKCLQMVMNMIDSLYKCRESCSQSACHINYETDCLKLRDCDHTFCKTCLRSRFRQTGSIITSRMENMRQGQEVMICGGTFSVRNSMKVCKVEVPLDQVRDLMDSFTDEDDDEDDYFKVDDFSLCSDTYCLKKSFIKIAKCGHRWCKECTVKRYTEGGPYKTMNSDKIHETREYLVCGIRNCTAEIPVDQLKQYFPIMVEDTEEMMEEKKEILAKRSVRPVDTSGTAAYEETLAKDSRMTRDETGKCDEIWCPKRSFIKMGTCHHYRCQACLVKRWKQECGDMTDNVNKSEFFLCGLYYCKTVVPIETLKTLLSTPLTVQEEMMEEKKEILAKRSVRPVDTSGTAAYEETLAKDSRKPKYEEREYIAMEVADTVIDKHMARIAAGTTRNTSSATQTERVTRLYSGQNDVRSTEDKAHRHVKIYLRDPRDRQRCSRFICRNWAFIEFCDCSHRLCRECLQNRIKDRTVARDDNQDTMVCGISGCTKEIPHNQLKKFLEERTRHYCDYRDCKSETEEDKMNIRHIFSPCGHRLCIICTSIQIEYKKNINCIVEGCTSSASGMGQYGKSDFPERQEIMGIPNVGLTCYASCILQVLGQTPNFREDLKTYSQHSEESHVDKVLDRLLTGVNDTANGVYTINWGSMDNLMRRIFRIDSSFRRYEENDCHSFIMTLLNALKKEDTDKKTEEGTSTGNSFLDDSNTDAKSPGKEESKDGRRPTNIEKSPGRQDNTKTESGQCPAVLFESLLTSTFTYTPCTHEECIDPQVFFSFLIPVQEGEWTVEKGLGQFLEGEEFTDNELPCRTCNYSMPKTITTRSLQITKAPKILMLQLARFKQEDSVGFYKTLRKTEDPVKFDMTLTIDKKYSSEKEDLTYELYGIVMHRGNMQGGHYTSLVKRQNTHRWYYCSDSCVREVPKRDILHHHVYKHAYVLFYSKQ